VAQSTFEKYALQVGAAIRRLRRDRNLTQEDVASEADVSIRHYQQLESGRMNPPLRTLFRVARVLGVPPNELLEWIVQRKR
jgi:transcriptional regulator with XRE-family HTH domain